MLDVFKSSLFETTTLTAAINAIPYTPGYLGKLNLFEEDGVPTTTVVIEKKGPAITILPTVPRGAPPTVFTGSKRQGFEFTIPHIPTISSIYADEVQNVRAFGTENQLVNIEEKRDEKLGDMSRNIDATIEYHRVGAVQGKVLDADGTTVLHDLFAEFGVSERPEVAFNLGQTYDPNNPNIAGNVRKLATGVYRDAQEDLGGVEPKGMLALCSDTFWDDLIRAPEIRSTYLGQQAANQLREFDGREEFIFAGIRWTNYRGSGSVAIEADKVRFVPLGVPGLFLTRFAPAPYIEAVNTKGLPKYTKAVPDPMGKFIVLEAQTNPLNICTRPRVLRKGKRGA